MRIHIERRGIRGYECSGCRRRTWRVRDRAERTWDDLPWAEQQVSLVYCQRRVDCRTCGIRTERVASADAKARITRRLRQVIRLDCQSMPTSHAAVRHARHLEQSPSSGKSVLDGMECEAAEATAQAPRRKWVTARPIRSSRDLARFLHPSPRKDVDRICSSTQGGFEPHLAT